MGGTEATRRKIANRQSVKFAAAHRMLVSCSDAHHVVGSHHTYSIDGAKIMVSKHRSGELLPYQLRAIDLFLKERGR